ncbi:hypothetical protein ES702_01855 [subsurface metagenome]
MSTIAGDYHIQVYTYPTLTITYDRQIIVIQTYDINPASVSVLLTLVDVGGDIYLSSYQVAAGNTNIKQLTAGQYYKIDCYVDVSETKMAVYVDNVLAATVPIYAGDAANPDRLYIGSTGNLANGEYWTDDILIDDDMTLPVLLLENPGNLFGAGFNDSIPFVNLRWASNLTDISFFEIHNSTDKIVWEYLGQSANNSYNDFQVVNGTERYYRVRACNYTGVSWNNSTWTDIDFEKVHYVIGNGAGPGLLPSLFPGLAIGISLLIIVAIYALEKRR